MATITIPEFADDLIFRSESSVYQKKLLGYLTEYYDLNQLEINTQTQILFRKGNQGVISAKK